MLFYTMYNKNSFQKPFASAHDLILLQSLVLKFIHHQIANCMYQPLQ